MKTYGDFLESSLDRALLLQCNVQLVQEYLSRILESAKLQVVAIVLIFSGIVGSRVLWRIFSHRRGRHDHSGHIGMVVIHVGGEGHWRGCIGEELVNDRGIILMVVHRRHDLFKVRRHCSLSVDHNFSLASSF